MKFLIRNLIIAGCLLCATSVFAASKLDDQTQLPSAPNKTSGVNYFMPPADKDVPNNAFGELVRRGEAIFVNTKALAPQYVGNEMNCVNCHLDRGRVARTAPLWGAYPMYPAYRKKNNKVNTYAERIQGCFQFSMNGTPPPTDSEIIKALTAYSYWMSTDAPTGRALPGRGYDEPVQPSGGYSITRGKSIYESQCALCHGTNGEGKKVGVNSIFPPLWGKDSYNWGAGMHRINTAAGYIQHAMPLGRPESLSAQEAWDVAAYINLHERPQDPRLINGDIEQTRKKFHESDGVNLYGATIDGVLIGQGVK
jgi:thiosulfate dehydrogenase